MKYFTKELWIALQGNKWKEADNTWTGNAAKYWKQFEKFSGKLSRRNYLFFKNVSFHDGSVESVKIENLNPPAQRKRRVEHPIRVLLKADNANDRKHYLLVYEGVISVSFDHPSDHDLFSYFGSGLGTWGYDELTVTRNGFFTHDILFNGGGNLRITFKHFEYSITKNASKHG